MTGTQRTKRRSRWPAAVALLVASLWACTSAADIVLLEISGSGVLRGQVFLDLDSDGSFSAGDRPLSGAGVTLLASGTSGVVDLTTADSVGRFALFDIPLGSYRVSLDSSVIGDSLITLGSADSVTIALGDTIQLDLGVTFEELSLDSALLAPIGRRIFTSGIALNGQGNFSDGQVHFKGASSFLRALRVERGALSVGDSVRLLGRVVADNGRPALDEVTFQVLIAGAELVTPEQVSTAVAATANDDTLDAALARFRNAEITDTSTTPAGHFRFWADDGSDSVEVVIRDFLLPNINTSFFRPDTVVRIAQATGLLSPIDLGGGSVRWRLLPRSGGDLALETKTADIAVTTAFDVGQASVGDTVQMIVAVTNGGPLTATTVQVSDTIPTGVSFLSATTTVGSYDDGTGVWNLGSLQAGAVDTLRVSAEVTVTGPATVTNIARSLGLVLEVDPASNNNSATAGLTIS